MTPTTNTINFQNTTTSTSQLSSLNIPTSPPVLTRMNATILNPPNRPRGISNSRSVSRNSLLSTRRRSLSRLINKT